MAVCAEAFRRRRRVCGERVLNLVAAADHFDEFAAPEFEVDFFVVSEDRGVVCHCVFEGFVDVAVEDGGPDFWGVCEWMIYPRGGE